MHIHTDVLGGFKETAKPVDGLGSFVSDTNELMVDGPNDFVLALRAMVREEIEKYHHEIALELSAGLFGNSRRV